MSDYKQIVRWIPAGGDWKLVVGRGKKPRVVAIAYANGTWHTFDANGARVQNWKEESVCRAKVEAAAAAIDQGFI